MEMTFNENYYISFSDKESAFIESIAEKYKLHVHDLILLSILSLSDKPTQDTNIDNNFEHIKLLDKNK